METKWRLLDEEERIPVHAEILAPHREWKPVTSGVVGGPAGQDCLPARVAEDGKGKYVLLDSDDISQPGDHVWSHQDWQEWVSGREVDGEVVRRLRACVKPPPGLWVVIHTAGPCEDYTKLGNDIIFPSWQEACDAAKHQARINGDGAEFAVAHIDRTFRCVVEVVEQEVAS